MNIEDVLVQSYFESNAGLSSWLPHIRNEFSRPYICHLRKFLQLERGARTALEDPKRAIYPEAEKVFAALEATPLCNVRVVIVGQDPYHNEQADGLAFSMSKADENRFNKSNSLKTIFEAVSHDLGSRIQLGYEQCNLKPWADQGVLLLNAVLSVRRGCPKSHYCQGWEKFTDKIIEVISQKRKNVVFLLWGKKARCKCPMIEANRGHKILCAPHPASRKNGDEFKNAKHFSQANCHLGDRKIEWVFGSASL